MTEYDDGIEPVVTLEGDLVEHRGDDEKDDENQQLGIGPASPGALHPPEQKYLWNSRVPLQVHPGKLAEELARRLEHHSLLLIERLFEYLSRIKSDTNAPQGLTLPASAIGWLASQLYPTYRDEVGTHGRQKDTAWMGASMRDRLSLLKYLLPRATHLRITAEKWPPPVGRTKKNDGPHSTTSFEGNDILFSDMSVHSALTIETTLAAPPSLQAFLLYYHSLQNHPRVDLRVFTSLTVLYLDRVPPEWITNMSAGLQLLRVDRSGMFDLTQFLFTPSASKYESEEALPVQFKMLTHLKLSHCAIGELSGLQGKKVLIPRNKQNGDLLASEHLPIPPPLSKLTNLVCVCLSNNELRTVRSAFAGLSSLTMLSRVDLSFNFLTSMKGCNEMVGNIKELILTGNQLRSVQGLDKCYSLETLNLDGNEFQDVADIATLANLPELTMLYMRENPLAEKDQKGYRVRVFDLFKESRTGSLLPKSTFRQLLHILPILDGEPASKSELVRLCGLTFKQSVVHADVTQNTQIASIKDYMSQGAQHGEATSPSLIRLPSLMVSRPRRVLRHGKRRRARVDDATQFFIERDKHSGDAVVIPSLQFSVHDLISSLTAYAPDTGIYLNSSEISADDGLVNALKVILAEESIDELLNRPSDRAEKRYDVDNGMDMELVPPTPCIELQISHEESGMLHRREMSYMSLSTIKPDDESGPDVNTNTFDLSSIIVPLTGPSHNVENEIVDSTYDGNNGEFEQKGSASKSTGDQLSLSSPKESMDTLPKSMVSFPEHVWGNKNDAQSIASSLGTNTQDFSAKDKYHLAEENSYYDGPDLYKHLSVMMNLELYFKSFVFVSENPEMNQSFAGQLNDEELSTMLLETAPRIQLRPLDRKTMESLNKAQAIGIKAASMNETFLRIWREDVLACGKSAARRVTPYRNPRRTFHGDSIFSSGELEKVCESRKLILSITNVAIYVILDYDQLAIQSQNKCDKRRFPSPIPQEALFQNAPWPHALARHPIHTLHRITIGFGLQRLTVRFGPGSTLEQSVMGNEYTYVITTCNKMKTISLLQQLQDQTKEASSKVSTLEKMQMTIDNDDKQVLDALSTAVAPSIVGIILHYQILQQRWKHGNRGGSRRVCVVTDEHIFLLDEDYVGDGSESFEAGARNIGEVNFRLVDSADLEQVSHVHAAGFDPHAITIIVRPKSRLQRIRNWRLRCYDAEGAERLVEDVRKAMALH